MNISRTFSQTKTLHCKFTIIFLIIHSKSQILFKNLLVCSLDARKYPLEKASHLALSDSVGTRSYFIMDDEPSKARLKIQNVSREDEGAFRCRVDFVNSPTRNFKVNLTLVG